MASRNTTMERGSAGQEAATNVEAMAADAPCFIEQQFPVARVSAESYKERKANYSQTLTGLGKWWGRKPLVLVRATILGLILPTTADPRQDREIFLKLMTMDDAGLSLRKRKKVDVATIYAYATESERKLFFEEDTHGWRSDGEIVWGQLTPTERDELFEKEPNGENDAVHQGPRKKDTQERKKEVRRRSREAKKGLEGRVFHRLPYSRRLEYCCRPEQIDGPAEESWAEINDHLGTHAQNLPELVEELGKRRFGHRPSVGDSFCGAGSVPFEAARIGCDAYGSDLSPVATLLTWAALNVIGGGQEVAREVERVKKEVFESVDKQVTEWGIEHNEKGWRADAYIYCVEVTCPECGWSVPLAPSWVIGERTHTIAELRADETNRRFAIEINEGVSPEKMKHAKQAGSSRDSRVWCPHCGEDSPIDVVRRRGVGADPSAQYHKSGLRLWDNDDLVPRPDDVYRERLYCIRWVETYWGTNAQGEWVQKTRRHYRAPDASDLKREDQVLQLLSDRFSDWQEQGYIPNRRIEPGAKTAEPIRTRGWTYWHHLFTPRQLLALGAMMQRVVGIDDSFLRKAMLLYIGKMSERNARLNGWDASRTVERPSHVFTNQALNPQVTIGTNSVFGMQYVPFAHKWFICEQSAFVLPNDSIGVKSINDLWITDPPYADAINYHELGEFFLAWYEKHLPRIFPDWYTDSKRALAVKADDPVEFRKSMVACYRRLAEHMPDNGLQVVMFTHQDAAVWADLTMILWAAGLRVTAAWCIATETDSALKQGNYVQGTVLLVCRKRTEGEAVFLDEINHQVETEVRRQLDEMLELDDDSTPNFADADYQLAAYAAALRVLTEKPIEEIDPAREITRIRPSDEIGPVEQLILNAVKIACDHLVPQGIQRGIWKALTPMERFYLKGLDVEMHGEYRSGVYQELARGFGATDYNDLLQSDRANKTRLKTANEFGRRMLSGEGFATSQVRQVLFATYQVTRSEDAADGLNWLRTEVPDYWNVREKLIEVLDFLGQLARVAGMDHWKMDSESARLLAGAVRNDHV